MHMYHVTVHGERFPTEYTIQAFSFGTAISRALREWRKRFKGKQDRTLTVTVIKGGSVNEPRLIETIERPDGKTCKCPDGYHDMFAECRPY